MKRWWLLPALGLMGAAMLRAQPADAVGWFVQGNLYYQQKDYDQALRSYAQSVRLDNRRAEAYEGLGNCLVAKGDKTRALQYYRWSLQLKPDNARLQAWVARLGGEAAPAAAGPEDALAAANKLYSAGSYAQAQSAYQALSLSKPQDARIYQGLGNAYYAQGRKDEALAQYKKSLALNPANKPLADFIAAREGAPAAGGEAWGGWFQPAWRSALVPGWGQFYNGQSTKGLLLGGLTYALFAGELATYLVGEQARQQYLGVSDPQGDFDTPYQTWESMANLNHVFYWGMAAAYTYTLVDAIANGGARPRAQAALPAAGEEPALALRVGPEGVRVQARVLEF